MEITSSSPKKFENVGTLACVFGFLVSFLRKRWLSLVNFAKLGKKLAKDDPRRIMHAIKVGMAISLVSLFYYLHPLYSTLGVSGMWAVLTVVVVFEYSVGGTIGKGTNRMVATCTAGGLAVGAHHLADLSGKTGEPILLLVFGFIVGKFCHIQTAIMTFMRFFPKLKARYDYGLLIFILTFSLVAVSGYRDDEVFMIALNRFKTIVVGCLITMLVCILICPVWMGTELHNLISNNIDKIGTFLEVFGGEFFEVVDEMKADKSSLVKYKSVLATKSSEDTMANLAKWEPGHGKFRFRHPWKQYLRIGALTRQCAYKIDALSSYLNMDSQGKTPDSFKETCIKLSSETGKALRELAHGMKKMKKTTLFVKAHLKESRLAAEELKSLLKSMNFPEGFNLLELLPNATVASLLIEIVTCTEEIAEAVNELAALAHFKTVVSAVAPTDDPSVRQSQKDDDVEKGGHVAVTVESDVAPKVKGNNNNADNEMINHQLGIAIVCK
ncbi:hypothetical protein V2J09_006922 [Rumex salicifolius]